ncbi:MAG: tRNA dihydrouridine synthase DusB [Spirochaetales bacterium]|nr:tRNA dihydrouridine synthase DusB [Spirochaetales bacterium]
MKNNYFHPIKIGNLDVAGNIFIAPLAGYTNLPTRLFYRKQGASVAYAEMVSTEGLNYNFNKSVKLIDTCNEDKLLGVQLFGYNAERFLSAFEKIKNEHFDIIDINCGCSVKKIIKSNSGAALLKSPEEIYRTIRGLKESTDKPVTLKIRSGWDPQNINYQEVYDAAEKGGASLITLHPRTKSMLFSGKANWEHIKSLKKCSTIPVIGNGDIFTADDAVRIFEETGCDGIMLARGVIENPFLVEEIIAKLTDTVYIQKSYDEKLNAAIQHCRSLEDYMQSPERAAAEFRKFFHGYVKGLPGASKLRAAVNCTASPDELEDVIHLYKDRILKKT